MKSICITGSSQKQLDDFAEYLRSSGSADALPTATPEKLSIHNWHEKAESAKSAAKLQRKAKAKADQEWNELAGEIFRSNSSSAVWHWADIRSLDHLDYWESFNKQTSFILLHSPLEGLIADLILANQASQDSINDLMDRWRAKTETMLQFHSRHPGKSELVSFQMFSNNKQSYVTSLIERWNLGLPDAAQSRTNYHVDPVALYLAKEIVQKKPALVALEAKVQTVLFGANDKRSGIETVSIEAAANEYAILLASNNHQQQRLLELKTIETNLRKNLTTANEQAAKVKIENTKINKPSSDDASRLDKNVVKDTTVERLKAIIAGYEQELNEETIEKNEIVTELHRVQELLEEHLYVSASLDSQLQEATTRTRKMLERYPEYWDYDTLSVTQPKGAEHPTLSWDITNLYLNGRSVPRLRFETIIKDGVAGIAISTSQESSEDFTPVRWPSGIEPGTALACIPLQGPPNFGSNNVLSSLSTTEWTFLKALVEKLVDIAVDRTIWNAPKALDRKELRSALIKLKEILDAWPVVFRYDAIRAGKLFHGDSYHHIEIKLENMALGNVTSPCFVYRIATVDTPDGQFGQNPRLEFPEISAHAFENWFVESTDHRGDRLELRFAQPGAMDIEIWNRLTINDKMLLAGIVGSAPKQIAEISHTHSSMSGRWEDWKGLAQSIKHIFQKNAAMTHNKAEA